MTTSGPQLIDTHHHLLPPPYLSGLESRGMKPLGGVPWPKWSPRLAMDTMDRHGVTKSILTLSEPGVYFGEVQPARELARIVNDYCAQVVNDNPQRFGALGVVPLPDIDSALKEVEYVLDTLKLSGITTLTNLGGRYIGDPEFEPFYAELNRRKAILYVHPTTPKEALPKLKIPPYTLEFMFDTSRAITNALFRGVFERYPDIRFFFTHAGGTIPFLVARLEYTRTRSAPQIPELETSTPKGIMPYLEKLYFDTASSYGPATLDAVGTCPGHKHILYGTDWPYAPEPWMPMTIKGLTDYFKADDPALAAIKSGNAIELFGQGRGQVAGA